MAWLLTIFHFFFFFFSWSGDHRDLHSFPTRRSSDLISKAVSILQAYPDVVAAFSTTGGGATTDRKSTRLNSSHMSISYAVFCLKKKKIERHPRGDFHNPSEHVGVHPVFPNRARLMRQRKLRQLAHELGQSLPRIE